MWRRLRERREKREEREEREKRREEKRREGGREKREKARGMLAKLLLTVSFVCEEETEEVIGISSILIIGHNSRINLEAEHKGIDPDVKQKEEEQSPLLNKESPSCFLWLV